MFFIGNFLLRIFALEGFVKARLAWLIPTKRFVGISQAKPGLDKALKGEN